MVISGPSNVEISWATMGTIYLTHDNTVNHIMNILKETKHYFFFKNRQKAVMDPIDQGA